jgi:hypothetical protein
MSSGPQWAAEQEEEAQYRSEINKGKLLKMKLDNIEGRNLYLCLQQIISDLSIIEDIPLKRNEYKTLSRVRDRVKDILP